MLEAGTTEAQLFELKQRMAALEAERDTIKTERDEYKRLYVALLEAYRKLEAGLVGQKRERYVGGGEEQLTLSLLSMLMSQSVHPPAPPQQVAAHTRSKPTGRKPLPENLPRIEVEVVPPDVQRRGLDAFTRIGEETSETVERRPASAVVVRTVRGKYVPKERGNEEMPKVLQAPAPELPIPRSIAGPGLLADTIVRRWQDHMPLHRMERMYGREGLPLARSTICGWHQEVSNLVAPLVVAMWKDALASSPYLCVDATGVLVQALEKCRLAHFFVVVAPQKHVLFGYSKKHDGKAVDKLLGGTRGFW